jgi:RNA polymerase sigma-70 factor (ECF subfamily)
MTTLLTEVHADESLAGPEQPEGDEPQLVRDAVGGSAPAFEQIVRLHHRRVFTFLLQMTRQRQDAEDLSQQTFIKAYHHLDRFDTSRPLINWLLVIARRTALNQFRSAKKWEEMPEDAAGTGPSPARSTEDQDLADNLWARARALLSPREYEVLWLRFGEDFSTKETARIAGLTETHVKVLVHRARQVLLKGDIKP